jgi:hypothetical protein
LKDLLNFSQNEKDSLTPETIELLHPYLDLRAPADDSMIFDPLVAKTASAAL